MINKFSKILVASVIAIFVVITGVLITEKIILGNDYSRKIQISDNARRIYNSKEDIIITGTANPESEIVLSWNGQFGLIESDKKGEWAVNLGTMPEGKYSLQMLSNTSPQIQSISTTQVVVDNSAKVQKKAVSFIDSIFNLFAAALSFKNGEYSSRLITIPQSTPTVLQGNWNLLE